MLASELNPYIRFVELRHCAVSYKTPLKAYDYRLFAIAEGECTVFVAGRELSLGKDSCLVVPPACEYRFIFNEHSPVSLYNINFSLRYLPGNGKAIRPDAPERFDPDKMPEEPDHAFFPVPTLIEKAPDVLSWAAELLREREERERGFQEICSALLKAMLLRLNRMPRAGEKSAPAPVALVKRYLEEHCRETVTGEELGARFGYHPYYLNRLFRQHTGQTIHLYQMQCRMKEACRMLTQTQMNVGEIAAALGFSSASYFCELFRKLRGVPPLRYREGMR